MELFIAVLIVGIAFYLLSVVTEEFFVPAIDRVADKLKLSSDASGATLLAMGSSAPEFFTSFFAVMGLAGAHADIGAGAIVGSAIFNVLVIVGAAAMFKSVKLQWQPVIRDQVFYILTILLLLWAFWDGSITLLEALIFVGAYGVYVFTVVKWRGWLKYEDTRVEGDMDEVAESKSPLGRLVYRILRFILPDPKSKLYPLTFLGSILAIAGLSWLLVQNVVVIAHVMNINPTFLALTVLAVGTSLPDLIGSIVVARQGRGDMAVSNAIGSNIFDVLFGLGLPWVIYMLVNGGTVVVGKENLLASVVLLFATVIAILFLLILRKWRIGHKSGFLLMAMYAVYCIYTILSVA